jgi:serine/threonine protein kinase
MTNKRGDLTGQTLGSCILEKHIGQGGMGTVYLARQTRPARNVAVKVLLPNLAMNSQIYQEFLARFRREADVIAKLEHVNIMPIYEYGEQDGLAYLVMPHLTGGSLRDMLARRGAFKIEEVITYVDQAASALDYAHAQGVIHRDLKPANFLLHADGRFVLADFGIARIMEEGSPGATLTKTGSMLGTPEYMAPEMAQGQTVDYRADIYELGIVLFEMLSGHVPFTGNTSYAVIIKHIQDSLPLLHQINPAISPEIDAVVQKTTAKQPEDRYPTVREMAQALRHASTASITYLNHSGKNEEYISTILSPSHSLGSSVMAQQDHTPPAQQQLPNTAPSNPAWSNVSPPPPPPRVHTPLSYTPPPYVPLSYPTYQTPASVPSGALPKTQQFWLFFIGILLVIALVIGGIFVGIQISRGTRAVNLAPISQATTVPQTEPSATATARLQATIPPTSLATIVPANVPLGTLLYKATSPGPSCDAGGGQWANFNGVQVVCQADSTKITNNPSQTWGLEGSFLTRLPGQTYPTNYVVQAQFLQDKASSSDFGLYFRNQPGAEQQGVYTFLVHPDGTWSANVYDNATGLPTEIGRGATFGDVHAPMTLAVVANGWQFSFYANGRALGSVSNQTYSSGTSGIAVNEGGSVVVSNFTLYTTAS